jgi:glutaredoxin
VKSTAVTLAMLCVLAGSAFSQPIYRWVDASGRVQYTTEKPPAGVKSATVGPRVSSYSGTPVVSEQTPVAPQAAAPAGVTMYSTDWCPYCRKARDYFARNGVRYSELDIEKSPAAKAEYDRLGGRGVPLILVGSQRMSGFGEERLAQMLKAAGH